MVLKIAARSDKGLLHHCKRVNGSIFISRKSTKLQYINYL